MFYILLVRSRFAITSTWIAIFVRVVFALCFALLKIGSLLFVLNSNRRSCRRAAAHCHAKHRGSGQTLRMLDVFLILYRFALSFGVISRCSIASLRLVKGSELCVLLRTLRGRLRHIGYLGRLYQYLFVIGSKVLLLLIER